MAYKLWEKISEIIPIGGLKTLTNGIYLLDIK